MTDIVVVEGDITTVDVDDGAIHRAGGPSILSECRQLRASTLPDGLPTGDAVATTAGDLPARWVIHTVGPVYSRTEDRSPLLRSAYRRSLEVAAEIGARTVAFPLVSAGVYGWPADDAVYQAVDAVRSSAADVDTVTFVAFSPAMADLLREELAQP